LALMPDTNVWIEIVRSEQGAAILKRLARIESRAPVLMSSVCRFELELGIIGRVGEASSRQRLRLLLDGPVERVEFSHDAAVAAAQLAARAQKLGRQMSSLDALIAGHASACAARLVTRDRRLREALPGDLVIAFEG
jgi:predicted nucleic acid-binding protein